LTLFFFKNNTFGCAYIHGAANQYCRAMHGGTTRVTTGQGGSVLDGDVVGLPHCPSWRMVKS
jgi:hypothetical protein